jgi:predicted transcriptional regulator
MQKEILQTLINLYQTSDGMSIKGEDVGKLLHRNAGTIRNNMQGLRSLGLVEGVPGPQGGYKPTIEAYHVLKISSLTGQSIVPIYKEGKEVDDVSVAKIEFNSVSHKGECEATLKLIGNIRDFNLGDKIRIGPTPVNRLGVSGFVVGRDDMDNLLLLDTTTIRSIPKKTVLEVATLKVVKLSPNDTLREASKTLSSKSISGAPVVDKVGHVISMVTLTDIIKAFADGNDDLLIKDIMSTPIGKVREDLLIADAIDIMHNNNIGRVIIVDENSKLKGIVTHTDIINIIIKLN